MNARPSADCEVGHLVILGKPIRVTGPAVTVAPNGPGRFVDKVVQPTAQSAEGCTYVESRGRSKWTLGSAHCAEPSMPT